MKRSLLSMSNKMICMISFVLALSNLLVDKKNVVNSFTIKPTIPNADRFTINSKSRSFLLKSSNKSTEEPTENSDMNRRSMISKTISSSLGLGLLSSNVKPSNAAIGSLYEYANTNAILQGLTINVADTSQQNAMIKFLTESFVGFKVLRQGTMDSVTDTWLGFGPEELDVPKDYEFGVNSFSMYGGHASLHIRYDAKSSNVYYKGPGTDLLGDNIAYLQVGVPSYKISKLQENNGNILDAFGYVNVISPCGLPIRGIVGIWPDPMMFVAINCIDMQQSKSFYEQLGFIQQV